MKKSCLGFLLSCGLLFSPGISSAGDRHFIYNYESGVLNQGDRELETYTTYRFGRDRFYTAIDQNLEFETGLGDGVQTSIYLNFTQEFADTGSGAQFSSGPILDGISNEWKFKLMDSTADVCGLGLYIEPEFEPDEFDLETKLIVDKKFGPLLWTMNILAAPAFNYANTNQTFLLRPSMGLGYFFTEKLFIGLEGMDENFFDDQPMRSVFSMGPVIQYSGNNWWVALTFLPQLTNIGGTGLDLTDSQKDQIRLATSFSL